MSKTKQITVYRFSELSSRAKEHAKYQHSAACGYSYSEEAFDSLKSLAEHFGGRIADWSIDYGGGTYSEATFSMPELERAEIESRLTELGEYNRETLTGLGDCKLTGYCADEDAIDGFRKAFAAGVSNLDSLMQAAFRSWLAAAISDYQSQFEDDVFSEMSDGNDYWYTKAGDLED